MLHQSTPFAVATVGIDIDKNTFHLVGLDQRAIADSDQPNALQIYGFTPLGNIYPRCGINCRGA